MTPAASIPPVTLITPVPGRHADLVDPAGPHGNSPVEQLGLHRIQLEVYGHNQRVRRVYEKPGFVVEGVLREAQSRDGEWVDEVVMGLLDREWNALRGHPEEVTSTVR